MKLPEHASRKFSSEPEGGEALVGPIWISAPEGDENTPPINCDCLRLPESKTWDPILVIIVIRSWRARRRSVTVRGLRVQGALLRQMQRY